jgi:hypothetical protein
LQASNRVEAAKAQITDEAGAPSEASNNHTTVHRIYYRVKKILDTVNSKFAYTDFSISALITVDAEISNFVAWRW